MARADNAAQTRRRILDAVESQLRSTPTEPLSLDRVAQEAGVARSTIYTSYGSRAGLLEAFVLDLWEHTSGPLLVDAPAEATAQEHLRASIAAAARLRAADLDVWRVLHALDRLDPDSTGGQVRVIEDERRAAVEALARRLKKEGALRNGVTPKTAAHVLWLATSYDSLDQLRTDRGAALNASIALLTSVAEQSLLRPELVG